MKEHNEGQDSDTVLVRADGSKLIQVVSNLLSNAVKFTDVGEILITIETKLLPETAQTNPAIRK